MLNFPLILPQSLESSRSELESAILDGIQMAGDFADKYAWGEHMIEPYIIRAEITDSKDRLLQIVHSLCAFPAETRLPNTLSGGLEQKVLFALSPELYRTTYPQGDEPQAFEKLVCHEIVHRLHTRILNGNEEAMGPIWFFEGFAVVGSNQFPDQETDLPLWKLKEIVLAQERGSYELYGKTLRFLLKHTDLPNLVEKARDENFNEWIISRFLSF